MAIKIETAFPGRSNSGTPAYPNGSFRNRSSETAEDGTYLRADWANDIFGFLSRLLSEAAITPDGNPDTVLASQYFTALESVVQTLINAEDIQEEIRDVMGATLVAGTNVTIDVDDPGNTITINAVQRTDEDIRDTAYAGLVAGEGIEIDVNDPADTATISAPRPSVGLWVYRTANGVAGTAIAANNWKPLQLSHEEHDVDNIGTLVGDGVSLPVGTYEIHYEHSAQRNASAGTDYRPRLQDITNTVTLIHGGSSSGGGTRGSGGGNTLFGEFTLADTATVQPEVYGNNGLTFAAVGASGGADEYYNMLFIRKLA